MPTTTVDERRLLRAGFVLAARNPGWRKQSLWRRGGKTYWDREAMELTEKSAKKEHSR